MRTGGVTSITLNDLLTAYASGIFPMSEDSQDSEIFWVDPKRRGVLPLDGLHIPRRLKRTIRSSDLTIRVDHAFKDCMHACSKSRPGRRSTWINDQIIELYTGLYEVGYAHSVEAWRDDQLVGGLYGVSIGGAFFGESMFSFEQDASKIALVYLVARLVHGGYRLLDVQFVTEHLQKFGVIEISKADYKKRLTEVIVVEADFYSMPLDWTGSKVLQSMTQTS